MNTAQVPIQNNTALQKKFRNAYVVKAGIFDFTPLEEFCSSICRMTDEEESSPDILRLQMEHALEKYDATIDVFVPVGSYFWTALATTVLLEKLYKSGRNNWTRYNIALYKDGSYRFWEIPISVEHMARKLED